MYIRLMRTHVYVSLANLSLGEDVMVLRIVQDSLIVDYF